MQQRARIFGAERVGVKERKEQHGLPTAIH